MKNKRKRTGDDDEDYSENSDVYFSEEAEFELEKELNLTRDSQIIEMKAITIPTSTPNNNKENDLSELSFIAPESISIPSIPVSSSSSSSSFILTLNRGPPSPLAHKEFKRRKVTEFLFSSPFHHPSPFRFQYPAPSYAILTTTVSSSSNSQISILRPTINSISRVGSKKLKKASSFAEPPFNLNEDLEDPDAESHREESTNLGRIIEAIKTLGGKATGMDISSWICKQYANDSHHKKKLTYTVNAVLSSKKHAPLFVKEMVSFDGHKRALWSLTAEAANAPVSHTVESRHSLVEETTDMDAEPRTRSEIENFTTVKKEVPTDEEDATDVGEEVSGLSAFNNTDPSKEENLPRSSIRDAGRHSNLADDLHQRPDKASTDEQSINAEKVPLEDPSSKANTDSREDKKSGHLEALIKEGYEAIDDELLVNMKAFETDDVIEETSEPKEEVRDGTPKNNSERNAGPEQTNTQPIDGFESAVEKIDDEEITETTEDPVPNNQTFREEERFNSSDAEERISEDGASDGEIERRNSRESRIKSDEDIPENLDIDDKEASTYTEMIVQTLQALGGSGTGVEITTYIDDHYKHALKGKTDTWRNSVMGCLSANRRNLFSKEPVKEHAKRYLWKLNDYPGNNSTSVPDSPNKSNVNTNSLSNNGVLIKRRKKTDSAPGTPLSGSEDGKVKRKNVELKTPKSEDKTRPVKKEGSPEMGTSPTQSPPATPGSTDSELGPNTNYVGLIVEALRNMDGKGTGNDITDWIAEKYKETAVNKKKLSYTVNAVLSSKKYNGLFIKDHMENSRAIWKLGSNS